MLDAAIQVDYEPFQRAMDQGANFISWPRPDLVPHNIQDQYPLVKDKTFMLGVVWPDHHAAFPDFYDDTNVTQKWWISEIKRLHNETGVNFDGIWIGESDIFLTLFLYFRYERAKQFWNESGSPLVLR
jgi:alpha-glucosidase